jgi:hypothetical protein
MSGQTQAVTVLELLRERPEGLTPLDALELAGCFRLAAVVHRLKADGHEISTELVEVPGGKHVARYRLHERAQLALAL